MGTPCSHDGPKQWEPRPVGYSERNGPIGGAVKAVSVTCEDQPADQQGSWSEAPRRRSAGRGQNGGSGARRAPDSQLQAHGLVPFQMLLSGNQTFPVGERKKMRFSF